MNAAYLLILYFFFFFKQKTAYEMRISDWSSDVCSSDLVQGSDDCGPQCAGQHQHGLHHEQGQRHASPRPAPATDIAQPDQADRSEEHTSELQSLMRISYAVFCLKKKTSQVQKHQQMSYDLAHTDTRLSPILSDVPNQNIPILQLLE